jgi:hypothetical protein
MFCVPILAAALPLCVGCLVPDHPIWMNCFREHHVAPGQHIDLEYEGGTKITLLEIDTVSGKCLFLITGQQGKETREWVSAGSPVITTADGSTVLFLRDVQNAKVTLETYFYAIGFGP